MDIMGVNGFQLLKTAVERGFPAVMLTAHALTPDALKKSISLGAISFLPKEKISDLQEFLEEVVMGKGRSLWIKFFDKLAQLLENGPYGALLTSRPRNATNPFRGLKRTCGNVRIGVSHHF